ncbi:MAG TPA: protein-glutamate O-methyltransferase CheR [Gemmatimonadaceae bacterium]|nr:protein-glutamate O-methyltransferase CheR [Gemmatimonadaceae bacterium]
MSDLTLALYVKLRDAVYARTGLYFDERKQYFFVRRLERRMELAGTATATEYLGLLGSDTAEVLSLAEELTTNETYFFREYPQLQSFADEILQDRLEEKRRANDWTIDLWCAGCSTGEEPYTLAIILREVVEDFLRWRVRITATDLSREVLRDARRATYGPRSVRDVPTVYLERYFDQTGDTFTVRPAITGMVDFRHANILDGSVARDLAGADFVFCRNVLIYFDDASRRRAVDHFYEALAPGGYIFLGHSESVGRITSAFRLVRRGGMLAYVK